MDSLLTSNDEIRPFYLYLFIDIIQKAESDQTLDIAATKVFDYIWDYPCEFFTHVSELEDDSIINKVIELISRDINKQNDLDEFTSFIDGTVRFKCSNYYWDIQNFISEFDYQVNN